MFAFEVSRDDVATVMRNRGHNISDEEAGRLLDLLDVDAIESAALAADVDDEDDDETLNRQTDAAHEEIAQQLEAGGHYPT